MITRLRAQQIVIDIPRTDSEPWIKVTVQRVEQDDTGFELNVVDRWGSINKQLSDVALEVNKYTEVLPLESGDISVYGLSDGIRSVVVRWIAEKYNGTISPNGDVIV